MHGAFLCLPSWGDTELPDPSVLGHLPSTLLVFLHQLPSLTAFPVLPSIVKILWHLNAFRLFSKYCNPNSQKASLELSASGPRISQNKVKLFYMLISSFLLSHAGFELQLFALACVPGKFLGILFVYFFNIDEHLDRLATLKDRHCWKHIWLGHIASTLTGCHSALASHFVVSNPSFLR